MFRRRFVGFILLCLFSLMGLSVVIFSFAPDIQMQVIFFVLLFLFLFSLGSLVLRSIKHGVLIGLFADSYLIMRLNNLTHPFFLLLLLGIFLAIELLLVGKKKSSRHLKQ